MKLVAIMVVCLVIDLIALVCIALTL